LPQLLLVHQLHAQVWIIMRNASNSMAYLHL
jgi:hypothetical protein